MRHAKAARCVPAARPLAILAAVLSAPLVTAPFAHAAWQSQATATLGATTLQGTVSPPTGITCTNGTNQVTISWTPGPTLATGYQIMHDTEVLVSAPAAATQAIVITTAAPNGNNRPVFVRVTLAPGMTADSATVLLRRTAQGSVQCGG